MLLFLSLAILAGEYEFIDISGLSGSVFGFSINGTMIKDKAFVAVLEVAILTGLFVAHSSVLIKEQSGKFTQAYRYYPRVVDELKDHLVAKTGRVTYGAPVANINPKLKNKEHKFGKYQRADDEQLVEVSLLLNSKTHFFALTYAVLSTVKSLGIKYWFPAFLGAWALLKVIT